MIKFCCLFISVIIDKKRASDAPFVIKTEFDFVDHEFVLSLHEVIFPLGYYHNQDRYRLNN